MKYARARFDDHTEEYIFRAYVTDSLNLIPDHKKLSDRFIDLLHPRVEDKRSGDEIAFDVIQNLGLRLNE